MRHILLTHVQHGLRHAALTDAGEDERNHVRRDAGMEGIAQHALFNSALLQAQGLLAGLLLFLPPPVLLGLGFEPGVVGGVRVRALGRWTRRQGLLLGHGVHGSERDIGRRQGQCRGRRQSSPRGFHALRLGFRGRGGRRGGPWGGRNGLTNDGVVMRRPFHSVLGGGFEGQQHPRQELEA